MSRKHDHHDSANNNNNNNNASDEDEMVFAYIVPHQQQQQQQPLSPPTKSNTTTTTTLYSPIRQQQRQHHPQDDDSNFFMSEPSLSEDGDSDSKIQAPHRRSSSSLLLGQQQAPSLLLKADAYDDDDDHDHDESARHRIFSSSEEEVLSYSDTDQQTERRSTWQQQRQNQQQQPPSSEPPQQQLSSSFSSSLQQQQQQQQMRSQIHESSFITQQQQYQHQHHRSRQLIRRREQNSPGNTSLSSWESPAITQKKVLLQFVMPESKYAKAARLQQEQQQQLLLRQQQQAIEKHQQQTYQGGSSPDNRSDEVHRQPPPPATPQQQSNPDPESTEPLIMDNTDSLSTTPSSVSSSSQNPINGNDSTRQSSGAFVRKAKNFVQQHWRSQSHPVVRKKGTTKGETQDPFPSSSLSFDDLSITKTNRDEQQKELNTQNPKKDRYDGMNGTTTTVTSTTYLFEGSEMNGRQNTTQGESKSKQENVFIFPPAIHGRMRQSSLDDSVNMTLSDSEADYRMTPGRSKSSSYPFARNMDWEVDAHNSADDEKTANYNTARTRTRMKTKPTWEHRRSRSGDGAAATLVTGGKDWKGMEQDKIPLPVGDDDDDESANKLQSLMNTRRAQRFTRQSAEGKPQKKQRTMPELEQRNQVPTIVKYPPLPAQCPIGNYGSLPPVPDTDKDFHSKMFSFEANSNQAWINQMTRLHQMSKNDRSQSAYAQFSATPPYYEYSSSFKKVMNGDFGKGTDDASGDSSEYSSADDDDDDDDGKGAGAPHAVQDVRLPFNAADTLEHLEHLYEDRHFRAKTGQTVLRSIQSQSPFANIGKKSAEKAPRSTFLPTLYSDDPNYPTFICPRCKTRQREFFTVENAASKVEGAGSYLTLYFAIYVICSLFVFGLEEGWMPLDCIYFAVITLTTAGLGDFVPTTDTNKLICSLFIYAGVSCIGLLLGTYIAGTLDNRAIIDRKKNQIDACPNCAKIELLREAAENNTGETFYSNKHFGNNAKRCMSERIPGDDHHDQTSAVYMPDHKHVHHAHAGHKESDVPHSTDGATLIPTEQQKLSEKGLESGYGVNLAAIASFDVPSRHSSPATTSSAYSRQSQSLGSPVTHNILIRQRHTRHASFGDAGLLAAENPQKSYGTQLVRRFSEREPGTQPNEKAKGDGYLPPSGNRILRPIESGIDLVDYSDSEDDEDEGSTSSYDSGSASEELSSEESLDFTKSKIQAAKYVFITLRRALVNSMIIIAVGALGFWVIERFTLVDSWYFTTVLLTTTGYGDIVPVTKGGKLFATIYILVAGTILLNNMSSISMIPLELRKRRIERAVLTQFGDHLDDAALRELATGPLIQRLRLSANTGDGLDVCTREMFSLAMLVRLGKVTEQDIKETFASFQRLDVNKEGVLNSRSIIAGMIAKKRQNSKNAARDSPTPLYTGASSPPPPPPPPPPLQPMNGPDGTCGDHHEIGLSYEDELEEEEKNMNLFWQGSDGSLHVSTPGNHLYHFKAVSPSAAPPPDERTALLPHSTE